MSRQLDICLEILDIDMLTEDDFGDEDPTCLSILGEKLVKKLKERRVELQKELISIMIGNKEHICQVK